MYFLIGGVVLGYPTSSNQTWRVGTSTRHWSGWFSQLQRSTKLHFSCWFPLVDTREWFIITRHPSKWWKARRFRERLWRRQWFPVKFLMTLWQTKSLLLKMAIYSWLIMTYPWKMVIFHGYVNVYQRVLFVWEKGSFGTWLSKIRTCLVIRSRCFFVVRQSDVEDATGISGYPLKSWT